MKKFIAIILACFFLSGAVTAFASPDTVSPYDAGNTYDLISVTTPQYQKDSTFSSSYVIEGYGLEGASVMVYWYDAANDIYRKVYDHAQGYDENGNPIIIYLEAAFTVGSSGQFKKSVELCPGANNFLLRAERDGLCQMVKISLTRYNYNLFDIIKSWTN